MIEEELKKIFVRKPSIMKTGAQHKRGILLWKGSARKNHATSTKYLIILFGPHLTGPEELCGLVDPPLHQLFHHVSLVHIHRDQCLQGLPKNKGFRWKYLIIVLLWISSLGQP
jgi:hypothetical protein